MKNNSNQTPDNMIVKMYNILKQAGATSLQFVKDKAIPLILVGGMAIGGLTACTPKNQVDPPSSSIVDSSSTTDSTESSTTNNYSQYSEILQYVLTNSEYIYALEEYQKTYRNEEVKPDFKYLPYSFYEDQGYNVISGNAQTFVYPNQPNTLYMATYAQPEGTNYYVEYLLKYDLTEQEMSDYKMIFEENNYVQRLFMNDAVAKFKTPEILSETKITVDSHTKLKSALSSVKNVKTFTNSSINDFVVTDYDVENRCFELFVFPTLKSNYIYEQHSSNYKVGYVPFITGSGVGGVVVENNIAIIPYDYGTSCLVDSSFVSSSGKKVDCYNGNKAYSTTYEHFTQEKE